MTAPAEFVLPDLGEGLTEAELLSWSVAVGDAVEQDQRLCEVETAKAVVELPAPHAGTVTALHAEPGTTVAVGAPLVTIAEAGAPESADAAQEDPEAAEDPAATQEGPEAAVPALVGSGPIAHRPGRPGWRRRSRPGGTAPQARTGGDVRVPAQPAARRAARERGVDLADVPPRRADGVRTAEDVDRYAPDGRGDGLRRTTPDAFRRATAEAVAGSARAVPHATAFRTVDLTTALTLLDRLRDSRDAPAVRLTPLVLVAAAAVTALRSHPLLNSAWDEDTGEIVGRTQVNLGIAVAGPRGLTVPNIPRADRLGLLDLAAAIEDSADTARAGRTEPARLRGGTFTITNIGVFGLEAGTAIINPGEAAILSLGTAAPRPWVCDGSLTVRTTATLGLSFDHRLIDGAEAGGFLASVASALENPLLLAD